MNQSFIIPGRLPGYNELRRGGHWARNYRVKFDAMQWVYWVITVENLRPISAPVNVTISCHEQNARRDRDNVTAGANKIILDALQRAGILQGDGQKYVRSITNFVDVDRETPRIEVVLSEVD